MAEQYLNKSGLDTLVTNIKNNFASKSEVDSKIPTKVSDLTNDSNFISSEEVATINGQSLLNGGQNITIEGGTSGVFVKFNELFAEGTITTNESDVFNVVKTAMESNTPLLLCDNNYSIIQVSRYPLKVGNTIIASGTLSQDVYNFTFTSGSNQITVTKLSVATLSDNLVSAQGLKSPQGKSYALPDADAADWADACLLSTEDGISRFLEYPDNHVGYLEGFFDEPAGNVWALPNSDLSVELGSENTLASKGDTPAYYIAERTANPLILRSLDNDTNCYPGKLISIYFEDQFQEDQEQIISINGNEYDLLPTGISANSGDTLLFVFDNDYIKPVQVAQAKELSTARSINGMNFSGSVNIHNFATCSTAASTADKLVYINNFTPNYGAQIRVQFTYSNTNAAPTLNVNNTGAKSMKYNGNTITNSNFTFDANKIYTFTCRDSSWDLEGDWDSAKKQDTLVSGTNIKTINGQSLLGSGDIAVQGGGSSEGGSSVYAEVNHGTSDRTFTLTPNTFHVWDEMTAMTLTLGAETTGVANEYLFQFKSPSNPTSLTLPDDIKFAEDLTIEANKIYQISILKGLGSVLSWDSLNLIQFSVNGVYYQAEDGMTWEDWIDSSYNTNNFYISSNIVRIDSMYRVVYGGSYDGIPPTDIIQQIAYGQYFDD